MLKCLFNIVAGQRPAALLKRDSSTGVFQWILQDFLEHLFCIWLLYVIQKRCSKRLTKFTAKFMLTAASGISENRTCLASCNLLMFCRTDCKSVYKVWVFELRCSFQMILHWLKPNQSIKVDDATQIITELYFDIQTPARGNTGT